MSGEDPRLYFSRRRDESRLAKKNQLGCSWCLIYSFSFSIVTPPQLQSYLSREFLLVVGGRS